MSYIHKISNYIVKFRDEESYLEAKLEYLKLYTKVSFIAFLQHRMYDSIKCKIEDISVTSASSVPVILSGVTGVNSTSNSVGTYNSEGIYYAGDIDFSEDIDVISSNAPNSSISFSHNSDEEAILNLHDIGSSFSNIVSFISAGESEEEHDNKNIIKKENEEPDDPIENRFDILDL